MTQGKYTKSFTDYLNKEVSTLDEQAKDYITKEIRSNLMSDAQTLSKVARAMQDHQHDKKTVKKVKDLEKDMIKFDKSFLTFSN